MEPEPNIEAQYRTLTVIWAALFASQFLFLLIIFIVKPEVYRFDLSKPFLPENASVAVLVLAFLCASLFLMSFFIKKKFLKQAIAEQSAAQVQTAMIVACAMCEAISLFGFVLAFAFDYQYFFLWFALGILGFILHFPKRDNLIAAGYRK